MAVNLKDLTQRLIPRLLPEFTPHVPYPQQSAFLLYDGEEALYGGAAGGGKSDALLMAALQYVDVPGYAALLLRRTFPDLTKPGALMTRAFDWLNNTSAHWKDKEKTWHFPSGATLTFGHMEHEKNKFDYQGGEYAFVGYDELTQFTESQYNYLFSRLRRLKNFPVPIRMRAASNPGGVGHEWVKKVFIDNLTARSPFFRARFTDNIHLDQKDYRKQLEKLDVVTRQQLLDGDWNASVKGTLFDRSWFRIVSVWSSNGKSKRAWDLAATQDGGDYTAGARWVRGRGGVFTLIDMQHAQLSPGGVKKLVKETAMADGAGVTVVLEQEPGASGASLIEDYRDTVLKDYVVKPYRPTGPKPVRWSILSDYAEAGKVEVLYGAWNDRFFAELELLGTEMSEFDDQADAASTGIIKMIEDVETDWGIL